MNVEWRSGLVGDFLTTNRSNGHESWLRGLLEMKRSLIGEGGLRSVYEIG